MIESLPGAHLCSKYEKFISIQNSPIMAEVASFSSAILFLPMFHVFSQADTVPGVQRAQADGELCGLPTRVAPVLHRLRG